MGHGTVKPLQIPGGLLYAHQAARRQEFHKLILVVGVGDLYPVPDDAGKKQGHRRHIPQKADPGEILRPGQVGRRHAVYLSGEKQVDGFCYVLPLINDSRRDDFTNFLKFADDFLFLSKLTRLIGSVGGSLSQRFEPGRADQQQPDPGFSFHNHC